MARWVGISGLLIMLLVNIGAPGQTAQAVATTRNPLIWLGELETTVTGAIADGNLPDRLARFEQIMVGRIREGNLVQRLTYLEALIYINQPYDIAITYKVQALEWIVFQQIFPVPLEQRVAD
jgi:hypothetical protein